jgi:hypothetical protein
LSLENLEELIEECRNQFDSLAYRSDIKLNTQLARVLKDALSSIDKNSEIIISAFSIEFMNKGLRATVPSSSLWYAKCFWPLSAQLKEYLKILALIKRGLINKKYTTTDLNAYLRTLPSERGFASIEQIAVDFRTEIDDQISDLVQRDLFIKFVTDNDWWFKTARQTEAVSGKPLDRSDVDDSALSLACRLVVANSAKLLNIIRAFESSEALRNCFDAQKFEEFMLEEPGKNESVSTTIIIGENVIFYGAPGVGKSHKIELLCNGKKTIRTVFHPDSQYSDFVGCLKPKMSGGNIVYEFRPGPFTLALVIASQGSEHVFLIIEEINRASSAAVFGELFQLLDRDDAGVSQYSITLSDPDLIEYLNKHAPSLLSNDELRIPNNLSLYATMNSSDQAVMPMDTAFKRRWLFEYLPVDFSSRPEGLIPIPTDNHGVIDVEWSQFAQIINETLEAESIPEDRLLGPWFLSTPELKDSSTSFNSLKGKLLLYLWDDVLRHREKSIIFPESILTFGRLISNLTEGKSIFNETLESEFLKVKSKDPVTAELPHSPETSDEDLSIVTPDEL